jgi:hypothetical protein
MAESLPITSENALFPGLGTPEILKKECIAHPDLWGLQGIFHRFPTRSLNNHSALDDVYNVFRIIQDGHQIHIFRRD